MPNYFKRPQFNWYFIFNLIIFQFHISNFLFGQITLTAPKNRMVYQRNEFNLADIQIEGTFMGTNDKIEARLIKLNNLGFSTSADDTSNWQIISFLPKNNQFSGGLFDKNGGWYILQVRTLQAGIATDTTANIKVGIGEVFVISGQSNAVGNIPQRDPNVYPPVSDRVNCINIYDNTLVDPPEMEFSHLVANSNIAPLGYTSWCWGVFADQIASIWDVPVLLFNTAIGNTSIFDWRASANSESEFCGENIAACPPYFHLKKTLNHYAKKTGIRAIFWHQGENDNGNFGNTLPPFVYHSNLRQVIDKSRADFKANISWVIAKVSRVQNSVNLNVTNGQQMTIDSLNYNTYLGPLSDNIQPAGELRDIGGVHFWGQGLVDLGIEWFFSISNDNFLTNSTPQPAFFNIAGCSTVQSGNWDDPSTWSNGRIPNATDLVVINIGHSVSLNTAGYAASIELGGALQYGTNGRLHFGE